MIAIADDLASQSSPEQRAKMLNAFALASRMEWYFWDEAYNMGRWKPNLMR
jgi:thiaminase (transcriptional activator TenA)